MISLGFSENHLIITTDNIHCEKINLELFDTLGRPVLSKQLDNTSGRNYVNLDRVYAGLYVAVVTSNQERYTEIISMPH